MAYPGGAVEAVNELVPADAHEETAISFDRCDSINTELLVELACACSILVNRNDGSRDLSVRQPAELSKLIAPGGDGGEPAHYSIGVPVAVTSLNRIDRMAFNATGPNLS